MDWSVAVNHRYLSRLPDPVRDVVVRIEAFADSEIQVEVDSRPVEPTDPNPDRLACEVTEHTATIWLRAADVFPTSAVIHELLHIERYWNERIPQIMPTTDPTGANIVNTSAIENALEHLIIVPREEAFGFDPYPYWAETARENWSTYPWPNMTSAWARRKNCLLAWLTVTHLTKDPGLQAQVRLHLRNEGLLADAEAFSKKITCTLPSKMRALGTVVRFLRIPYDEVTGMLYDVQNRRRVEVTIPFQ